MPHGMRYTASVRCHISSDTEHCPATCGMPHIMRQLTQCILSLQSRTPTHAAAQTPNRASRKWGASSWHRASRTRSKLHGMDGNPAASGSSCTSTAHTGRVAGWDNTTAAVAAGCLAWRQGSSEITYLPCHAMPRRQSHSQARTATDSRSPVGHRKLGGPSQRPGSVAQRPRCQKSASRGGGGGAGNDAVAAAEQAANLQRK